MPAHGWRKTSLHTDRIIEKIFFDRGTEEDATERTNSRGDREIIAPGKGNGRRETRPGDGPYADINLGAHSPQRIIDTRPGED